MTTAGHKGGIVARGYISTPYTVRSLAGTRIPIPKMQVENEYETGLCVRTGTADRQGSS